VWSCRRFDRAEQDLWPRSALYKFTDRWAYCISNAPNENSPVCNTFLFFPLKNVGDSLASLGSEARPAEAIREKFAVHGLFNNYAIIFFYMQEPAVELLAFMNARSLKQTQIAKLAHVSQPSVSRALKVGTRKRRGSAYTRLFSYIHKETRRLRTAHADRTHVLQAFDRIWGTSQAHAAAVAKVIDALDALRPPLMREE